MKSAETTQIPTSEVETSVGIRMHIFLRAHSAVYYWHITTMGLGSILISYEKREILSHFLHEMIKNTPRNSKKPRNKNFFLGATTVQPIITTQKNTKTWTNLLKHFYFARWSMVIYIFM